MRYVLISTSRENSKRCIRSGLIFLCITAIVVTTIVYTNQQKNSNKESNIESIPIIPVPNINIIPSTTINLPTEMVQILINEINTTIIPTPAQYDAKLCYTNQFRNETIDYLENILTAHIQPESGQNIFFHETSCILDGLVTLNPRQACAIESAAKTNPSMNIFVLFTSPVGFEKHQPKPSIISALFKYSNIHFRHVDLWSYASDTIHEAEVFIKSEALFKSQYLFAHTADFLRILSLYRYGGSHFDLDFIVKKNLAYMQPNFACEESENYIGNGFLNFAQFGIGHQIIQQCLLQFSTHYDGTIWGINGPYLITNVLKQVCQTKSLKLCSIFRIFSREAFFPISYGNWLAFFNEEKVNLILAATNDSIAVHFWNKLSSNELIQVGSNVAYGRLAEEYCPNVYGSCGLYF